MTGMFGCGAEGRQRWADAATVELDGEEPDWKKVSARREDQSKDEPSSQPDVLVANEGTVFLFNPLTAKARQWINEHVQAEDYQWLGTTLVVEHRYAWGLAEGMKDAGLVLR